MGFPRHLTGVPATFLGLEVHGQNNPWPRDLDHHARCKLNLVWNLPPILFLPKAAFTPSLQGPWNHGAAGIEHCAPIVRYRRHHGPRPVTLPTPYRCNLVIGNGSDGCRLSRIPPRIAPNARTGVGGNEKVSSDRARHDEGSGDGTTAGSGEADHPKCRQFDGGCPSSDFQRVWR